MKVLKSWSKDARGRVCVFRRVSRLTSHRFRNGFGNPVKCFFDLFFAAQLRGRFCSSSLAARRRLRIEASNFFLVISKLEGWFLSRHRRQSVFPSSACWTLREQAAAKAFGARRRARRRLLTPGEILETRETLPHREE